MRRFDELAPEKTTQGSPAIHGTIARKMTIRRTRLRNTSDEIDLTEADARVTRLDRILSARRSVPWIAGDPCVVFSGASSVEAGAFPLIVARKRSSFRARCIDDVLERWRSSG